MCKMLYIVLSVCWSSACLLWRNVFLGLLTTFWLGCLFFCYGATWTTCIFWRLILCGTNPLFQLQLFFSILRVVFSSYLHEAKENLIMSHILIFVFISIILGGGSKRILLWFMSKSGLPVLSSEFYSFRHYIVVFNLVCFVCVCGVRKYSNFILLHVAIQFSQHHLLKRMSLPHCIFVPPL